MATSVQGYLPSAARVCEYATVFLLFTILMVVTFRTNTDDLMIAFGGNKAVDIPALVQELNSKSIYLAPIAFFSLVAIAILTRARCANPYPAIMALLSLYLFEFTRCFLEEDSGDLAGKVLASTGMTFVIFFAISSSVNKVGLRDGLGAVQAATFLFSAFLVIVNFYVLLTGAARNAYTFRFYGTTSQPNFLGVQMAICFLVIFSRLNSSSSSRKWLTLSFLGLTLWIIIQTGSRTSLIQLAISVGVYWISSKKRSLFQILRAAGGPFLLSLLVLFGGLGKSFSAAYDRGGTNTRQEAWEQLISRVHEYPLLGSGYMFGFSENSYLRGWATYGIIFPMLYLVVIVLVIRSFTARSFRSGLRPHLALYGSLLLGIFVAGVFEGVLTDTMTFPIIMLNISLVMIGEMQLAFRKAERRLTAKPVPNRNRQIELR